MTLYRCNRCWNHGREFVMVERPTREKGRCPNCGHKLFPDGYTAIQGADPVFKFYPAPSWEEDIR